MGKLVAIYLRPSARTPVREVAEASAQVGVGLEGDHAHGGKRQVTLLAREAWAAACGALGEAVPPASRRANLLVEGVDLRASRGRRLRLGEVEVVVEGETRPCGLMDDARLGLRDALAPEWRGGVYGRIEVGGAVRVGDPVAWV